MRFVTLPFAAVLLSSSAVAINNKAPPKTVPPHIVDGFPWKDPFTAESSLASFEPTCEAEQTFNMYEYTLHDLMDKPPYGLNTWAEGLKKLFSQREYPGSWSGYDHHGYDRTVLRMNYSEVPLEVRLWIEDQERTNGDGKGYFGVFENPKEGGSLEITVKIPAASEVDRSLDKDRVAIFAPGVLYYTLPLWVAEESSCKDDLLDLAKYKPEPEDGKVTGWVDHRTPSMEKRARFRVRAKVLKAKPTESPSAKEDAKAEL